MSDSFFSAKNQFDEQFETWTPVLCESIIEAAARRISKTNGTLTAATRIQRVADICAGAHVLPIDHWQKLGKPTAEAVVEKQRSRWQRFLTLSAINPVDAFWAGAICGIAWASFWR